MFKEKTTVKTPKLSKLIKSQHLYLITSKIENESRVKLKETIRPEKKVQKEHTFGENDF
jgi:hypothetical protein